MTSVLPDIYGYEIIKLNHRLIIILSWPNPLIYLSPTQVVWQIMNKSFKEVAEQICKALQQPWHHTFLK